MTRTVAAAFDAVEAGDDGPLAATLAPVFDEMVDDAGGYYDDQAWILDAELGDDVDSALQVGCGHGGLLTRLTRDHETVVGVDAHPDPLWFAGARTDAGVTVGDPRALPVEDGFDAWVALGQVVAGLGEEGTGRALEEAFDALAPGGRVVLDAAAEPTAVPDDPWEEAVGRFLVHRSVVAGDVDGSRAEVTLECTVTDTERETAVETSEHRTVELFDREGLSALLSDVGFVDVEVTRKPAAEDALLATATRPGDDSG